MRRLFLIVLVLCLLAVPAAGATLERTPGSVYLQFVNGAGAAKVRYKGNFFGRVVRGRIVATRNVKVSGYRAKRTLASGLIEYRGPNSSASAMGFFTPAPPAQWRLRLFGRGISASGFVHGCMTLDGVDVGSTGRFRVGENGVLRPWPRSPWTRPLGAGC